MPCPVCPCQVPKLVDRYMAGETMLDQYISHEMPFDQVPRPPPCPCWMVSLHLHARLLTACSNAVLQRPTCRLQTVASTSATHIPCLNDLFVNHRSTRPSTCCMRVRFVIQRLLAMPGMCVTRIHMTSG